MGIKLVCFDMDGVIFEDINFWFELHKRFGTLKEGLALTEKYLKTDYDTLVREVVQKLWKGRDAKPYFELVNSLKYVPGVKETFEYLKNKGCKTAIISASGIDAAKRVQKDFAVDCIYANELVIKDNKVSGEFIWPVGAGNEKKAEIIKKLCKKIGISPKECAYIGDSETDIEAFKEVGLSIAFNTTSDKLKKAATYVVSGKNLKAIVPFLG